jgi:hypothetical protein
MAKLRVLFFHPAFKSSDTVSTKLSVEPALSPPPQVRAPPFSRSVLNTVMHRYVHTRSEDWSRRTIHRSISRREKMRTTSTMLNPTSVITKRWTNCNVRLLQLFERTAKAVHGSCPDGQTVPKNQTRMRVKSPDSSRSQLGEWVRTTCDGGCTNPVTRRHPRGSRWRG